MLIRKISLGILAPDGWRIAMLAVSSCQRMTLKRVLPNVSLMACAFLGAITLVPSICGAAGLVDQYQLNGGEQNQAICCSSLNSNQRGQTFTAGLAGALTGLELSLYAVSDPANLDVSILDMNGGDPRFAPVLGTVSVPLSAVGPAPTTLDLSSITATYIDLSSLGIFVNPGDPLAFRLQVAADLPSLWAIGISLSDDYSGGSYYAAQTSFFSPFGDAAFKTFVETVPEPGTRSLLAVGAVLLCLLKS